MYVKCSDSIKYFYIYCIQDREKSSALQAVGIMALAVRDKMFSYIDPILNVIKSSLPSSREIAAKYVHNEPSNKLANRCTMIFALFDILV